MKRLLFILMALIAMISIQAQNTYILVVGVSRYENEKNNLGQTTKDAKDFKKVMSSQTNNISILTSKYANRDNIKEKLKAICNRAQADDKIIFYYSGHGYPGGLYTYDGRLSYQDINDVLAASEAKAKIVFIDACHAGSVNAVNDLDEGFKAPKQGNIIYMLACRDNEYSSEWSLVGHGIFTQALLKGLRGKADANNDKSLTLMELFVYVYNDVLKSAERLGRKQHPQLIGSKEVADVEIVKW